jgi:serine/threonine protein kinase
MIAATFFLMLHTNYAPYRSLALNRIQQFALVIVSIIYLTGVLLKTDSVSLEDGETLGVVLVIMLVVLVLSVLGMIVVEVRAVLQWQKELRFATAILKRLPQFDPSIQEHLINPDEMVLGGAFTKGSSRVVRKGTFGTFDVAIKLQKIRAPRTPMNKVMKGAQAEAQLLLSMRHPNVVAFYGMAFAPDSIDLTVMTVLELCVGSLEDVIFDAEIEIGTMEKLELCQKIAQGLAFLHSKGIVHRDIQVCQFCLVFFYLFCALCVALMCCSIPCSIYSYVLLHSLLYLLLCVAPFLALSTLQPAHILMGVAGTPKVEIEKSRGEVTMFSRETSDKSTGIGGKIKCCYFVDFRAYTSQYCV